MKDLLAIVSLVFAIVGCVFSVFTYFKTFLYERKKSTIAAYLELQDCMAVLYSYKKDEIQDFVYDMETEEYKALSNCVAMIEIFAVGINNRIYDFNVMYEMSHGYLDKTLRQRIEYILELKLERAEKEFYPNIRVLFNKMDRKTKKTKIGEVIK